jgi:spartin
MLDSYRLLLSIPHVLASQIYEGEQTVLAQGPLNVILLSQPLEPIARHDDLSRLVTSTSQQIRSRNPDSRPPLNEERILVENDLLLYLSIGANLFDLPLPAYTRIIPRDASGYLILSPDIPHAVIRLDLASSPPDELETFEVLLSQFTAYEERSRDLPRKDLILVDSKDGSVVGSVPQASLVVHEDSTLSQAGHEKDPVLIEITSEPEGRKSILTVSPLTDGSEPTSSLLQAANLISSGIIYSSTLISKGIHSSVNHYTKRTRTSELPITFQPNTMDRIRKIHHLSNSAAVMSSKATGFLASAAHSLGAGIRDRFVDEAKPTKRSSLLNKSLIAFETVAESIDTSAKQLLGTTSDAATTVVRHKYGDQAAEVSHGLGSVVRNIGLVYVDARGVTRKALIKGAAKGVLFKAKIGNGEEVIIGGGESELMDAQYPQFNERKQFRARSVPRDGPPREDHHPSYSQLNHPGVWTSGKDKED